MSVPDFVPTSRAYDGRMSEVLTERDGGVLTITLNRPDKLNAFTGAMHAEFAKALEAAADPEVRAVVITGAGRGFCVGQDLSEFEGGTGDIAHRLRYDLQPERPRAARAGEARHRSGERPCRRRRALLRVRV